MQATLHSFRQQHMTIIKLMISSMMKVFFLCIFLIQRDTSTTTITTAAASPFTTISSNHHHVVSSLVFQKRKIITTAFAASPKKGGGSKNKKNKKQQQTVGAGFGQSTQPNIQDLDFPTRLPPNAPDLPCPCRTSGNSDTLYKDCCFPFHNDKNILPQSPLDVLKTRYTAFAWRIPQYIIETTHPACKDFRKDKIKWARDLNRSGMFDSYDFVSLDVVGEESFNPDNDGEGFIEFKVNLKANSNSGGNIEGQDIVVQEKSRFLRTEGGGWKYAGGDVTSDVAGLENIKLNN